jgi:RecB family exonuclease
VQLSARRRVARRALTHSREAAASARSSHIAAAARAGFVEFWRTELKWQQMSKEEKEQWFADNPEYAYAKQG